MVEQRGEEFTDGLVVRPFIPLKFVTADWTGMPMFEEYRLLFWRGEFFHSEIYNPVGRSEENFTEFLDVGSPPSDRRVRCSRSTPRIKPSE